VSQLCVQILERSPDAAETTEYLGIAKAYVAKLGKLKAIQKLIQTFILSSEFAYRQEFGTGPADEQGRRMLSPRDAAYALAYALTDQSPDQELVLAAQSGKLSTREDYKREVQRLLKKRDTHYLIDPILADKNYQDNTTDTAIRKLRFFREFFGYPAALTIFKDEKRFGGDRLDDATCRLVNEADRTVGHILKKDQNVFEELLSTEEFYLYPKSVCFLNASNKKEWEGTIQAGIDGDAKFIGDICVCISTFNRESRSLRRNGIKNFHRYRPYVALVEGEIGRLPEAKRKKIPASLTQSHDWEFHSCVVIVDIFFKNIFIMNPWMPNKLRSGIVKYVRDIRVGLVKNLVQLYKGFKVFHTSGTQVSKPDCRVHCLKFIRKLGQLGREESLYNGKIAWTRLIKK
jgi:hypothetical protein